MLKKKKQKSKKLTELNVHIYFQKATIYLKYEKFNEAIILYNTGKQLLGNDTTNCLIRGYYEGVAHLFYKQERYKEALESFRNNYIFSSTCLEGFDRFVYMQANLDNIGMCYDRINMPDSALYYYYATLDYIKKEEHLFLTRKEFVATARAVVYRNLASLNFKINRPEEGEYYAKNGIDIIGEYNKDLSAGFYISLLKEYLTKKRLAEALPIINMLDKMPVQHMLYLNNHINFYQLKSQYYLLIKDTSMAFQNFEKYTYLKDSAEVHVKAIAPLDMRKEFEFAQEKLLNQNLQKDNQLKRTYLWLATSLIAIVLLIVAMIANNLRRSRKNIHQLQALNNQIFTQNNILKQTLTSLEQSHNENTQIVRTIGHDLKNPVGGIKMIIQRLLKKEDVPEKRESLEMVVNTCTTSLNMINDLISGSKSQKIIQKDFVNLAKLLKDVVWLLQAKANEKNQKILLSEQEVFVYINHQMIWRLFSNIITNAIKFSSKGSKIKINIKQENNSALVAIEDRGIGIPKDLQENIFAIENNASRPGTNGEISYGLGLIISKRIVEDHHGRLWFTSTEGVGSTFYIELPTENVQNTNLS